MGDMEPCQSNSSRRNWLVKTGLQLLSARQPDAAFGFFQSAGEWASCGFCKLVAGQWGDAYEFYRRAPETEDNQNAVASVMLHSGNQTQALQYLYDHIPQPWSRVTTKNAAFGLLGLGRWGDGWKLFRSMRPPSEKPIESLDEIRGQRVVVAPQYHGFGDSILEFRWVSMVAAVAADTVVLVKQPLRRLIEVQGIARTVDEHDAGALVDAGWRLVRPLGDFPFLLGTTPETIPGTSRYLNVPVRLIYRSELPPTRKFRVGLVWQGAQRTFNTPLTYMDMQRSMPFELMAPILALANTLPIEFLSLQLGDHHRDHPNLTRVLDDSYDYLDTAAVVEQLDLVISVDTSIAHLAGALSKPVWMLSRFCGCWRWGWGQQQFDWYDSMRQYRQQAHGAWPAVIAEVVADLTDMVSA